MKNLSTSTKSKKGDSFKKSKKSDKKGATGESNNAEMIKVVTEAIKNADLHTATKKRKVTMDDSDDEGEIHMAEDLVKMETAADALPDIMEFEGIDFDGEEIDV